MEHMTQSDAVLALGIESVRIAVPVARSLHRRGIAVDFATIGNAEKVVRSRAVRSTYRLPNCLTDPAGFESALLKLAESQRYSAILPLSDRALVAIGPIDSALRSRSALMSPPPDIVDRVLDKAQTVALARGCGVRVPESYLVTNLDELDAMKSSLKFPLIAKGRSRHHLVGFKVAYFNEFGDLQSRAAADPEFLPNVLLQEYVGGDGLLFAVLMHRGAALSVFQHRRLSELPASGGVGVLLESEQPDPSITAQAIAMLRAIEWDGICSVEFRHDRATGDLWLLEVNGRYWGSLTSAIACGLDLPYYHWQLTRGYRPAIPKGYKSGVRVRWIAGDVARLRGVWNGTGTSGMEKFSKWRETLRFVADFNPRTHAAPWSVVDPLPAILELWYAVRGPRRPKLA
jgi:predicted ATP-grasp superfamily ATP-dependent carboligase